ncbi:MAG: hypothetical protein LUI05_00860, partial [Oscillospiraceae bacterium]|nr:hypothetical protein [Oscillospiraceae bacterium]
WSPKPRAVSSNLTAPAKQKPVDRYLRAFDFLRFLIENQICVPLNLKSLKISIKNIDLLIRI